MCVRGLQVKAVSLLSNVTQQAQGFKINSEARSRGIVCEQELRDHA